MRKTRIRNGVIIFFALLSIIFNVKEIKVNAITTEVTVEAENKKTFFGKLAEKRKLRKLNSKIKSAKKAMKKKKYDKVLEILKPQLVENPNSNEAKILCVMIENYRKSKTAFEEGQISFSKELIEEIDESYEEYKISIDINDLKSKIEVKELEQEEINTKIDELNIMLENEEYEEGKALIKVLMQKSMDEYQKAEVETIAGNINEALEEIEEQKKYEEEQRRLDQERIKAEEEKVKEEARKREEAKAAKSSGSSNSGNNNSNKGNSSSGGGTYYIAAGNRYYHKPSGCKFLEGAATTKVSDVSNKFPCNCIKYN